MTTLFKDHALVVLSGGQDSTTCLFDAITRFPKVSAITFNYGQRHQAELMAAARVWALACRRDSMCDLVGHETVEVGPLLKSTSPLVSAAELEQYPDYHSLPGGLEKTFVPMRNQFFLTLAANHAVAIGAGVLVTGVCQEDSGGYPDCREGFIAALEYATNLGLGLTAEDGLEISTPLMNLTKAASVHLALATPGAYAALAYSHTSYDGQYPPTGHDHATLLRAKGFAEAGVADPLVARAAFEGLMAPPSEDTQWLSDAELAAMDSYLRANGLL